KRNHLAAQIKAKGRKQDLTPVIGANNADADQGGSRRRFRLAAASARRLRATGTETSWQSHSQTISDRPAPTVAPGSGWCRACAQTRPQVFPKSSSPADGLSPAVQRCSKNPDPIRLQFVRSRGVRTGES